MYLCRYVRNAVDTSAPLFEVDETASSLPDSDVNMHEYDSVAETDGYLADDNDEPGLSINMQTPKTLRRLVRGDSYAFDDSACPFVHVRVCFLRCCLYEYFSTLFLSLSICLSQSRAFSHSHWPNHTHAHTHTHTHTHTQTKTP